MSNHYSEVYNTGEGVLKIGQNQNLCNYSVNWGVLIKSRGSAKKTSFKMSQSVKLIKGVVLISSGVGGGHTLLHNKQTPLLLSTLE